MGEKIGARVELDKVPLKYAGLRYPEIWISEAQERMVLSVPPHQVEELLRPRGRRKRGGHGHRGVRHPRPPAHPHIRRARSRPTVDGVPPRRHPAAHAQGRGDRTWHGRPARGFNWARRPCHGSEIPLAGHTGSSQHRFQALDHPSVRSRSPRRLRRQAAPRSHAGRPLRRRRAPPPSWTAIAASPSVAAWLLTFRIPTRCPSQPSTRRFATSVAVGAGPRPHRHLGQLLLAQRGR